MTKKTCEVDGVAYVSAPTMYQDDLEVSACIGCVANPDGNTRNSVLCDQLDDCVQDNIIWVVKV